jgi:hypothetical protein
MVGSVLQHVAETGRGSVENSVCGPTTKFAALGLALAVAATYAVRASLPHPRDSGLNAQYSYVTDVFSDSDLAALERMVVDFANFSSQLADITSAVEEIGEGVALAPGGECADPLQVPSSDRTRCVFPQRLDAATTYLKFGGRHGVKEPFEVLVARGLSYLSYNRERLLEAGSPVARLFASERYGSLARAICGASRPVLDAFQLNMILVPPGGELIAHYDVPYLWSATRFTVPQWLLVAMDQSGLWANESIAQIQGVSWLHADGSANNSASGGAFFFYPRGNAHKSVTVPSARNAMLVVDGCRVVHGVERFRADFAPLPRLDKDGGNRLVHVGGGLWHLQNAAGRVFARYATSDLRISLAWRQRCFASTDERDRFHRMEFNRSVDDILDTFERDLRARGRIAPASPRPQPRDFALLILDEYARYPVEHQAAASFFPYNVCALPRLLPKPFRSAASTLLGLWPACNLDSYFTDQLITSPAAQAILDSQP